MVHPLKMKILFTHPNVVPKPYDVIFFSLVSVLTVTVHSDHICQATKKHYKSNVEVLVSCRMASKDVKYSTRVIWNNFMLIFGV